VWLYILFPVSIFVMHLLFLNFLLRVLPQKRPRLLGLTNLFLYPLALSSLLAVFFHFAGMKPWNHAFSAFCVGFLGYYFSFVLSLLPFVGPLFRELDMEFLLLGLSCALGSLYDSPVLFIHALGSLLTRYSLLLVLALVSSLIISTLVKYLIARTMVSYQERDEALKGIAWSVSISAGVMGVPIAVFFRML
jgi:hypothetical protein